MSKTLTCREMGGTCDEAFSGEDLKAIGDQGYKHLQDSKEEEHVAMFAKMQTTTPEQMTEWNTSMQAKLDAKDED